MEYIYGHFQIVRKEYIIFIFDENNNLLKQVDLLPENITMGKINIPLSNVCTMKCKYCSEANSIRDEIRITTKEDIILIIDTYFKYIKDNADIQSVRLSFDYGGEPVCQLNTLESISNYFRKTSLYNGKKPVIQMTTNCAWNENLLQRILIATDEVIVSIDGGQKLHEKYRIHRSNNSVYQVVLKNAEAIYRSGKLKQISSVITVDTVTNVEQYVTFLAEHFPNASVKMSPVIVTGDAENNDIEKIKFGTWMKFMEITMELANGRLKIIDTKPEKSLKTRHLYGCEHIRMTNWFYWLDGKITCCTNRNIATYVIGNIKNHAINMDYDRMDKFINNNHIDNITKCTNCLAKYYCAGGCPNFRDKKINCNKRIEKYAKLLLEKV